MVAPTHFPPRKSAGWKLHSIPTHTLLPTHHPAPTPAERTPEDASKRATPTPTTFSVSEMDGETADEDRKWVASWAPWWAEFRGDEFWRYLP